MVSNCAQTNGIANERNKLAKSFSEAITGGRQPNTNGESIVPIDDR